MNPDEPIDIYIPGNPGDPRDPSELPDGIRPHYGPALHPDDVTVHNGIPVTTVARTLIDLAEVMSEQELRECFDTARAKGLLDLDELAASRRRVEWRPSLAMLDRVIASLQVVIVALWPQGWESASSATPSPRRSAESSAGRRSR